MSSGDCKAGLRCKQREDCPALKDKQANLAALTILSSKWLTIPQNHPTSRPIICQKNWADWPGTSEGKFSSVVRSFHLWRRQKVINRPLCISTPAHCASQGVPTTQLHTKWPHICTHDKKGRGFTIGWQSLKIVQKTWMKVDENMLPFLKMIYHKNVFSVIYFTFSTSFLGTCLFAVLVLIISMVADYLGGSLLKTSFLSNVLKLT